MPSPLDLLEGGGQAIPPPSPPSNELLDSVMAEGRRRKATRRVRTAAAVLLALVLLAVPAAAQLRADGDDRREADLATDGGEPAPETTLAIVEPVPDGAIPDTTAAPAPVVPPPVTTVPPATVAAPTTSPPRTAPATTATTARQCRNSTDSACGPFRWDPPPTPNQPLVASFTRAPSTAVVGQPVAFEVSWSDGDATLTYDRFATDGTSEHSACSRIARYGPWTPPAAVPGSGTLPYTTTFPSPGTYKVTVVLATGGGPGDPPSSPECTEPYGSATGIETTVTVTAARG